MWIIFILLIVAIIIGKFVYDTLKQSSQMKQAGGMKVRYSYLISTLLGCENAKVTKETPTYIEIGGHIYRRNQGLSYAFWLQHLVTGKLSVKLVLRMDGGKPEVVKQWLFDQYQPQKDIITSLKPAIEELQGENDNPINTADGKLSDKYPILLKRLKMEGKDSFNFYKVSVLEDSEHKYVFNLDMKYGHYNYTIYDIGDLVVKLSSTTYIKGAWKFPLKGDQNSIADKIEDDINTMVINYHENKDFYD